MKALFCVVEITTSNINDNFENLTFRTIGTLFYHFCGRTMKILSLIPISDYDLYCWFWGGVKYSNTCYYTQTTQCNTNFKFLTEYEYEYIRNGKIH